MTGEQGTPPLFGNGVLVGVAHWAPWAVRRLSALWDLSKEIAEDMGMAVLSGSCHGKSQRRDGIFLEVCDGVYLRGVRFDTREGALRACFEDRTAGRASGCRW